MANPYFEFKQFKVFHDKCGMKVSTDACILGAYAKKEGARRVLDIGAGSGLLSLMAAQNHPEAQVEAVELDAHAFEQMAENFERSPWANRLRARHVRIQDFEGPEGRPFDLIVSNPPFYPDHNKAADQKRSQAFHTDALSFEDLAKSASRLLSDDGQFFVLLPKRQSEEFRFVANLQDLYVQKSLQVVSKAGGGAIREIKVYGKRQVPGWPAEELTVYQAPGEYTEGFVELLQPFYLYL